MQPIRPQVTAYGRRPLWRNYLFAYFLIGAGFLMGDIRPEPMGNRVIKFLGLTLFVAGLAVFAAAVGYSVWFVAGGKSRRNGEG